MVRKLPFSKGFFHMFILGSGFWAEKMAQLVIPVRSTFQNDLHLPIGGPHPVLYFTTQTTKKYCTAMCYKKPLCITGLWLCLSAWDLWGPFMFLDISCQCHSWRDWWNDDFRRIHRTIYICTWMVAVRVNSPSSKDPLPISVSYPWQPNLFEADKFF